MPDPDYKALCAELVVIEDAMSGGSVQLSSQGQALDGYVALAAFRYIAAKARIALAQPEPAAPTDEEIDDWHGRCADLTRLGEADHYWAFDLRHDEVAGVARAVLARWGTPANNISEEN